MRQTISYVGTLVTTSCWCGIHMAIPNDLHAIAKRNGTEVYCPLGHSFVYGETVTKELARQKELTAEANRRATARLELLHAEERSHAATRGHLTRQKKRIAAGVCPCCKRHFRDLHRHMAGQHPNYSTKEKK